MKKNFILGTALLFAGASFVAAQTDITPSRYKFSEQPVGPYVVDYAWKSANPNAVNGGNINAPIDDFNNGFVAFHAGAFASNSVASELENAQQLQAGINIVDLGGDIGKVLCIKGKNALNDYAGSYLNYLQNGAAMPAETSVLWWGLNFYTDHQNTPHGAGEGSGEVIKPVRMRIVYNIFHKNPGSGTAVLGKHYSVSFQNDAPGAALAEGIATSADYFSPMDEDTEETAYDMTQWVVREFDATYAEATRIPGRMKLEFPGEYANGIVYIKEITFTIDNTEDAEMQKFITLTPGAVTSIDKNIVDQLKVSVIGNKLQVLNAEQGEVINVYSTLGQQVASVVVQGNDVIELGSGIYVVRVGDRSQKVVL